MGKAAINQLKVSGFKITQELEKIVHTLPYFEVVEVVHAHGIRRAVVFVDNNTDLVIKQKIEKQ